MSSVPRVIGIILIGVAAVCLASYVRDTAIPAGPIVLETGHLAELAPHEHESGDAVSDTGHHVELSSPEFIVPHDMAVTDVDFEILNAPKTIVHHAVLLAFRCADSACTHRSVREIVRHGQDTMYLADKSLPAGYMIPLEKGERLVLQLTAHNPEPPLGRGDTYHDVYARITLSQRSAAAAAFAPVHFVHLFVSDTCDVSEGSDVFTVPAHTATYRFGGCHGTYDRSTFTFHTSGTIVHMGAHLHGWQGGEELTVHRNGKPFHVFHTAVSQDDPFRYDTEYSQDAVHVSAGDTFTIEASYRNMGSVPARGAMGMLGMFVADDPSGK